MLKIAGAVYLCRLGAQALRRSFRPVRAPVAVVGERPRGVVASYRAGVVANVSNPKAAVLYLALFPQFLPADGGTLADTAALAVVQMSISASYYLLVVGGDRRGSAVSRQGFGTPCAGPRDGIRAGRTRCANVDALAGRRLTRHIRVSGLAGGY